MNINNNTNTSIPQGKSVLYFADLDPTIRDLDLKNFLGEDQQHIYHIELTFPKNSPFIAAIVIFKDNEKAREIKHKYNMRKLKNRTCRIMWHDKEQIKNLSYFSENNNIFVKNIPIMVSARQVYETFSEFGEISSVKLNENNDGSHKGYGYISYENSSSAIEAIKLGNNKPIFKDFPQRLVEVEFFKKSNQRSNNYGYNYSQKVDPTKIVLTNSSIFIKDLPENINENEIKSAFVKFGNVTYIKPNIVDSVIKTCILSFDNEGAASQAEKENNNIEIKGKKITVEKLNYSNQQSKPFNINQNNFQSNRNCSLYIKNIPDQVNEEILKSIFSEFGLVTNVFLYKNSIMRKEGGTYKEHVVHTNCGQIHYNTNKEAMLAIEKMNNKFIPGFEGWKFPLLVDIYLTSKERTTNRVGIMPTNTPYQMNMMGGGMMPQNFNGFRNNNMMMNNMGMMQGGWQQNYPYAKDNFAMKEDVTGLTNKMNEIKIEQTPSYFTKIDMKHFNSISDVSQKKDYMGEILFNNISNNPSVVKQGISMDDVGKITGMILGIEDINEILLPCTEEKELSSRIEEALRLLKESNL